MSSYIMPITILNSIYHHQQQQQQQQQIDPLVENN